MANITKISVNGEVYDINPAWVDVTDGGFGKLSLAYNAYEHKLNIFDAEGYRVSIPLTKGGPIDTYSSSETSGTSGTTPAP